MTKHEFVNDVINALEDKHFYSEIAEYLWENHMKPLIDENTELSYKLGYLYGSLENLAIKSRSNIDVLIKKYGYEESN